MISLSSFGPERLFQYFWFVLNMVADLSGSVRDVGECRR